MFNESHHRRPKKWVFILLLGVVVLAAGAYAVKSWILRDRATAVSTDDVLDRYRDEIGTVPATVAAGTTVPALTPVTPARPATVPDATAPAATAAPTTAAPEPLELPRGGVYVYETTGKEHITALGGTEHEYPNSTTITVVPGGCGVTVRWDALAERWEQWDLCLGPDGISRGPVGTQYHEFYGYQENEQSDCDRPVLLIPSGVPPAEPVQQTCEKRDQPWLPVWEILETSTRELEGESVAVQHVRMTVEDTDKYFEHQVIDFWLAPNGLPVEVQATQDSLTDGPVGDVEYTEHYEIDLVSLTPLR